MHRNAALPRSPSVAIFFDTRRDITRSSRKTIASKGMEFLIPTSVFLTSGVGVHRHRLTAFEFALRDANIEQQNLVTVSSILPPRCRLIPAAAGIESLKPGEITFCVLARAETDEPGRRIHASIGLARPADPDMYGYISEHHGFGMTREQSGDYAEDLAATMLASTLGIDFDPEAAWDERKELYQHSHLIIDSLSLTAAAEGDAAGHWTCALTVAVFRFGPHS
jgi:arginine decarboxylase